MSTLSYDTTGMLLLKGLKSPVTEKDLKAWLAGNYAAGEYYVPVNGLNYTISFLEIMWRSSLQPLKV